jgi:hypothetical protein
MIRSDLRWKVTCRKVSQSCMLVKCTASERRRVGESAAKLAEAEVAQRQGKQWKILG